MSARKNSHGKKLQKKRLASIKVALVYDRVNKWGGAERVLLSLHKIFPQAPLYTSVYNKKKARWADIFDVKTSFLQKIPYASSFHELLAPLMPFAFEQFSFDKYDIVISVTSEAAKGIKTKDKTLHICYCLTPTRYLWSGYDEYFKNAYFRFLAKPMIFFLRRWDIRASRRPDIYVAISKEVQNRIKKYYGRESRLIYPGVMFERSSIALGERGPVASFPPPTSSFDALTAGARRRSPAGVTPFANPKNYFLIVSRLVSYKRIDLAIRACNKLGLPLVVVGKGAEEKRLRRISGPTITFAGHLTQRDLLRYYRESRALIFPGVEDFGLVMLEAQLFGKPVIAFKAGGALEIIVNGKTGEFFTKQTVASLSKTLKNFDEKKYKPAKARQQANKFTHKKFVLEWKKVIKEVNV